ncbi:MAG: tetraacyldisaccharide 4'-kinase [Bacteroidales bacterium]|nr:tetraacyldisaccharide 4'-kinase [Bacteroidales bacterium]
MSKRVALYPLLPLYKFGVWLRNKLFDWKVLKSESFDIPVISIGNIAVGGTGKTPHSEYLIGMLKDRYNIALLSRGYKRKSKGFILADENSTVALIGDEPFQIKQKFKDITVAVDADRRNGIRKILELKPQTNLIILDDAFQHRYVTPKVSILLSDYNNMFYNDSLLPVGNLREPASARFRANIVIITKCPENIIPIDKRIMIKRVNLFPYQKLFFSSFSYNNPIAVFKENEIKELDINCIGKDCNILAVSGIANPSQFDDFLRSTGATVKDIHFSDHHNFSNKDINNIIEKFYSIAKNNREKSYIITTEKDAARILNLNIPQEIKMHIYALPLVVKINNNEDSLLEECLIKNIKQ